MKHLTTVTDNIKRFIEQHIVVTLEQLLHNCALSRASLFRHLGQLHYCRSYNCNGRFYTLRALAHFDRDGLWSFQEIRFSQDGSLPATLIHLVQDCPAGYTALELKELLHVKVQDHLALLERRGAVVREREGRHFRYFAASPLRHAAQKHAWSETLRHQRLKQSLDPQLALTVVLEVMEHPRLSPDQIADRLSRRGVSITPEQVREVFEAHEVERKRGRWIQGLRS